MPFDTTNIFIGALPSLSDQKIILENIHQNSKALQSSYPIQWEQPVDLHITLGYLRDVKISDISKILPSFNCVENHEELHVVFRSATVYGTALCLQLDPSHQFLALHQSLCSALHVVSRGIYQFQQHIHFDPHMTLGRIQVPRHRKIQAKSKENYIRWMSQYFKTVDFTIKNISVLHRAPTQTSNYQVLKTFHLKKTNSSPDQPF